MPDSNPQSGGQQGCQMPRPDGRLRGRGAGPSGLGLLLDLVGPIFRQMGFGRDVAEVEAVRQYVDSVRRLRLVFVASLLAHLCLLALFAGFLVMHMALVIALPWSPAAVAGLLFVLGGVYAIAGTVALWYVSSSRFWAKLSGAGGLARKAVS